MEETRTLVRFLNGLRFSDLPKEVVEIAKLCVLDTVGVGIFASRTAWATIVAQEVREAGGKESATVWAQGFKTSPQQAALANGTAAHGIEMDDRKPDLEIHIGAMAIPAALAAAEHARTGGKELILGVVAGYEVAFRLSRAVMGLMRTGVHGPGHKGTIGTVAAACKVLGLNEQQTLNAYGLAGSMASGLWEFTQDPYGTMVKRFHGGWAAHNGVLAAKLGQRGLTAPSSILEGPYGYCQTYARGTDIRLEELTKGLGESFQIMQREIKPYASWGGSHTAIEAVYQIKSQHNVKAEQVDKITVGGSTKLLNNHSTWEPKSIMAAQYSLPFLVAAAFYKDLRNPGMWTDEVLADKEITALAHKVELYNDPEHEEIMRRTNDYAGAKMTVRLKDGREYKATVFHSKGMLENPSTPDEIRSKYALLAGQVLPPDRVSRIMETIDSLETVADIRGLGELLR